jgi:hypothetical protein
MLLRMAVREDSMSSPTEQASWCRTPLRHRAEGLAGLTRPALADRGRRRFPADPVALVEGLALPR